jgi:3-methyl-2-oxobutanoate hydroxymethyltransferase
MAIVIESVPESVSAHITSELKIPTIGIGAGNGTSGQVLVYHDMLGLYPNFVPKFCKQYANLAQIVESALKTYKSEVETRAFPSAQHSYTMKQEEFQKAFPEAASECKESPAAIAASIGINSKIANTGITKRMLN